MDLWTLSDLCTPWCIHVAATLRVAENLAAGPADVSELAKACSADPDALQRLLRHLVSKGVFEEPEPGRFALNDLASQLPAFRLGMDLDSFGGRMAGAWSTLLTAVRAGSPAYHEAFGRTFWEDLEAHPQIAADFDLLMGPAGHGAPDPNILADPADWESMRTVVDVGGGTGSFLAAILQAHPHLHGTLVDLPRTVARSAETFRAAGVESRVRTVAQSFFDPLPFGADLYTIKNVLGDWPDPEATAILKRCADAARPAGRVVWLTNSGPGEPADPDLLMLVLVGGRSRTIDEYRALTARAGMEIRTVSPISNGRYSVDGRPI
jgi:SAM-dependent methyltransferase